MMADNSLTLKAKTEIHLNELINRQDSNQTLSKNEVTKVTQVTTSNGAVSGVTSEVLHGGTEVTKQTIPALKDRPQYVVFDKTFKQGDKKYRPGVWFFGVKTGRENGEEVQLPTESWICTPLHIRAITHDDEQNNFGRLLRFRNSAGAWREFALPMELLRGGGEEMRGLLLNRGVEIDPHNRNQLTSYIQSQHPSKTIHCVNKTGWYQNNFVLPDCVIGGGKDSIIFQSGFSFVNEYKQSGTLDGWREIPQLANGNPALILALSSAFAGVLLDKCGVEGIGIHFHGDSSSGKTTLIEAARSVWGGRSYRRSWRATANGLEGAASMFNDNLICLDEISECDPSEVGKIVYALGNGYGKQRADKYGDARSLNRWRCFVLSNGEREIKTSIAESGRTTKAGQEVRLIDVPAVRTYGVYDCLNGFASGAALSDRIIAIASDHYGHAGRMFLESLVNDRRDMRKYFEKIKKLSQFHVDDEGGQSKRVSARFALIGLAGELATEYSLTQWKSGAALSVASEYLKLWQSMRGKGNSETRQIVDQVQDFISRYGDSKFSCADSSDGARVNDRAGWWKNEEDSRIYLFTSPGLREALKGFDFNRGLAALKESGLLQPGKDKTAKNVRIKDQKGVKPLYHVKEVV